MVVSRPAVVAELAFVVPVLDPGDIEVVVPSVVLPGTFVVAEVAQELTEFKAVVVVVSSRPVVLVFGVPSVVAIVLEIGRAHV